LMGDLNEREERALLIALGTGRGRHAAMMYRTKTSSRWACLYRGGRVQQRWPLFVVGRLVRAGLVEMVENDRYRLTKAGRARREALIQTRRNGKETGR